MARAYYAPMTSTVITMDRPGGIPRVKRDFYVSAIVREKLRGWQSTTVRTFLQEFTDFIELTKNREGGGVIAQGIDGYRSIEIANAIYRASETGQPVTLSPTV